MADSNSSQQCGTVMMALKGKEYYNHQVAINIHVSRSILLYDHPQERFLRTYRSSRSIIFAFDDHEFLSGSADFQRQFIHKTIQRSDVPFSLETVRWIGTPSDPSSVPKFENMDSILNRLSNVARDCVQDKCRMVISITELRILNADEYGKAQQILDDWLVECKNGVNNIHCIQDYPLVSKGDGSNYKKNGKMTMKIWNEDQVKTPRYCSRCMNLLRKGTNVVRMSSCSHIFHASCILPWFLVNLTCPLCPLD